MSGLARSKAGASGHQAAFTELWQALVAGSSWSPRRGLPEAIRRAILADRAAGRSIRAIARARGVSPTTVQKVIKEASKPANERRAQPWHGLSLPLLRKAAPGLIGP